MSTHPSRRLDRPTAERLLRGERVGYRADLDPLTDLLAAAAAPPSEDDLAGERAAMSAFRTARLGRIAQPEGPSVPRSLLSKLLTAKIIAAAIAVGGIGGVAVAAATDTLPAGPGGPPAAVHPADPSSTPAGDTATPETPDAADGARGGSGHAGPEAGAHATPSPSMVGLCRGYLAKRDDDPGHALDSPAFEELITHAGGAGQVADYCATVLPPGPRRDGYRSDADREDAQQRAGGDRSAPPRGSVAPTSESAAPSEENAENDEAKRSSTDHRPAPSTPPTSSAPPPTSDRFSGR